MVKHVGMAGGPIKATQLHALIFIEEHGVVTVYDLMHRFNYQHRRRQSSMWAHTVVFAAPPVREPRPVAYKL